MIKLNTWKKMGLMVVLINQTFAATPCVSTEEPFYRKWRGCDMPSERGTVKGDSRVVHERYARGFLSFNTYVNLPKGIYILKFDNNGSVSGCQMDRMINFDDYLGYYDDGRHMGHMDGFSYVAGYNLSRNTQNDNCQILYSNLDAASILFKNEKNVRANLCCFSYGGSVVINSIEILRVGDNGFSSHPMMRQLPFNSEINYGLMKHYFTDLVHRGFHHALAAMGDTITGHADRQHHTNEFLKRVARFGNPDFKPLEHFCGALDTRFKRLDEKDAETFNQLAQLRDTFLARNGERETQVRDIWGGINEARQQIQQKDSAIQELQRRMDALQSQITTLTEENQRLITIVNEHERMVEKIQKSIRSSSPRSVSAGRQARH